MPSIPNAPQHDDMWDEVVPGLTIEGTGDDFVDAVEMVSDRCFTVADDLGWHKAYDALGRRVRSGTSDEMDYLNWIQSRMMAMVGEIGEAREELRNGRDVKDVYYRDVNGSCGPVGEIYDQQVIDVIDGVQVPQLKPEGWLVEMADVLIGLGDLVGTVAGQEGVFFGPIVAEKLQWNAANGREEF